MYNRYIKEKFRNGTYRRFLVNLCYQWAKEIPLTEILTKELKYFKNQEDTIEEIIEILQNSASYSVPLLLKPIFDIKKLIAHF